MKPYPPLGLLYVVSFLKAQGIETGVFDSTFCTLMDFYKLVITKKPKILGLYCNMMTKFNILKMINLARPYCRWIILGGPEPVNYVDQYLASGADIIVIGEGEKTMSELVRRLLTSPVSDLHEVHGIAFTNGTTTIRTQAREQISDLSSLPWPDRNCIDVHRYLQVWKKHHGYSSTSLILSRGCPYTCAWCSHSVFGETSRRRTPSEAAEEIDYLVKRYRPDQVWYADDVFAIHRRWFFEYADELDVRRIRTPFECISRADRLNEDVVRRLASMRCKQLWIGSESGSQRILDAMDRRARVEDIQEKVALLKRHHIRVGMFIMFGYEGETLQDIRATAQHLKKCNPDVVLTTVSYPLKGTPYYNRIRPRIVSPNNWASTTDRDQVIRGRYSRMFYRFATSWIVNSIHDHLKNRLKAKAAECLMFLSSLRGRTASSGSQWSASDRSAQAW
jgi:radical SAM superfamily enzyme YgiQ (UPF0313 family)